MKELRKYREEFSGRGNFESVVEGYLEFIHRYGENEEDLGPSEIRRLLHW